MIYYKHDALESLVPNANFRWVGMDYSGLEWNDSRPVPTDSEIEAELVRLKEAEPVRLLREQRTICLAETDWMANSDVTMSDAWKTYRQQLRDLPANTSDPANPTWPTKPS